jgi:ParB-like chromosome segregation protein Spo0J
MSGTEVSSARLVPIDSLKPAPWNPRLLRDERFKSLCASIQADPDMMRLRPVLAQGDGTIYAGNMRWRAVKHSGQSDVWAVVEDVPDQLAKERALRDNNNWGEWQDDELAELLANLQESGSVLDLLGFEQAEIDRLLSGVGIGDEPPAGFPTYDETIPTEHTCPKCGYRWSGGSTAEHSE